MAKMFLSHSSLDSAPAMAVRDWLAGEGWDDVFLDLDPERGIKAGERWQEALKRASSSCELVIFLISPAWVSSKWCQTEFMLAKQMNKRVVAAVVKETPFESIPVEMTAEWQIVDLTAGTEKIEFSVDVPIGEQPEVVRFAVDGLKRLKIGLLASGLDPKFFPWPPEHDPQRRPYRGLRALEEEDAGIFFGRDGSIVDGLDLLRGLRDAAPPRMLVILGASGAGKSSFMRAGLLPRLQRDSRHYRVLPVVRPHGAVLEGDTGLISGIDRALHNSGQQRTRAEIRKACTSGADALAKLLAPLAETTTEDAGRPLLVLPVDQGEELFLADGVDEARSFLRLLSDLLRLNDLAIATLVTIRSDSYEPLQSAPALEGIVQRTYSLPPMPKGAYKEVIDGPARRLSETTASFEVDPPLVDALLDDIGESAAKDALPLLAFTLERLYREYGAGGSLTLAEYEETGRIRGSIEAAVEQALKVADGQPNIPRDRAARLNLLRRAMIPALAGVDPDTGTPRRRVARLDKIPAEARPLVQLLIDQHLLSTDVAQETGVKTVEPAHEALLRQWSTLEGWLDAETEDLTMAEGTFRATRDWKANAREPEWLVHNGARLQLADRVARREDFANLFGAEERAYLDACREAEAARRSARRRVFAGALSVVLILVALVGWQWLEANAEADRARSHELGRLVAYSTSAVAEGYPVEATKLALAGWPRTAGSDIAQLPLAIRNLSGAVPKLHERMRLQAHDRPITSIAISPDGRRLATASEDNTARLWDLRTGEEIKLFDSHTTEVTSVAFSPNGATLATGSDDGNVRLFDLVSTGEPNVKEIETGKAVLSLDFSSDGIHLVTGSHDGSIHLLDIQTGEKTLVFQSKNSNRVNSVALSPTRSRLAAAVGLEGVYVFDADSIDTRRPNHQILNRRSRTTSVRFSADGKFLATGLLNGRVKVWKIQDGNFDEVLTRNVGDEVWSVALSDDGSLLAAGGEDRVVRIVSTELKAEIARLEGHRDLIRSVAFSPTERLIVTGSSDGTVRIWDVTAVTKVARLTERKNSFLAVAFAPDGLHVATGGRNGMARIWDIATGNPRHMRRIGSIRSIASSIRSIAFSANGARLATGSADGMARLWTVRLDENLQFERELSHESVVTSLAFSPDGTRIATGTANGQVRLWKTDTGELIETLGAHSGYGVPGLAFSPDGATLVTASGDKTIRLWEMLPQVRTHARLIIDGHSRAVSSVAFSPAGDLFATGSSDNSVRIWDAGTGREVAKLDGHSDRVTSVAFSPDGGRLASSSWDRTVRLWDMATMAAITRLFGHAGVVLDVDYSPDGTRLISAGSTNTLLWDISEIPEGNIFRVACAWLPNHDADVSVFEYQASIDEPICGESYDPPPPEWIGGQTYTTQKTAN